MLPQNDVRDVTLNGSAEVTAGSSDETVPFTFRATTTGYERMDLELSTGTRTEIRHNGLRDFTGVWQSGNGDQHLIAAHNLFTGSSWEFPALLMRQIIHDPSMVVFFKGREESLLHLVVYKLGSSFINHMTYIDIWLDSVSFLPNRLEFNTHSDKDATLDIPVSIEYSRYETTPDGIKAPFRIQKLVNGTLALDVELQSVTLNSGLSDGTFSIQ
jgi:hypothetical protein